MVLTETSLASYPTVSKIKQCADNVGEYRYKHTLKHDNEIFLQSEAEVILQNWTIAQEKRAYAAFAT